ncbi:MAG TPA: hypothetical protein VHU83_11495 [Bryobacteraceae bacterium]|jgi:hypothetical protein|nr:hypothetical protein [Bryobacteraceae bacterium]
MNGILDRFIQDRAAFRPATMDELFALALARRLGDPAAARHYVTLAAQYSPERLVRTFHRILTGGADEALATRFHQQIQRAVPFVPPNHPVPLLAIKVERRSVAAAVFVGRHLEDTHVRHLSSAGARAQSSAISFVNWIMSNFELESAALECIIDVKDIRRVVLTSAIREACIAPRPLSLWQFPKRQLFESFGYPALRSRKELRQVVLSMWPVLADKRAVDQALDAVALGALVQTERLFLN